MVDITILINGNLFEVAITPDGTRAYVVDGGYNIISVRAYPSRNRRALAGLEPGNEDDERS
jgi:DNA-binding beta-propeller fold protein YncE